MVTQVDENKDFVAWLEQWLAKINQSRVSGGQMPPNRQFFCDVRNSIVANQDEDKELESG